MASAVSTGAALRLRWAGPTAQGVRGPSQLHRPRRKLKEATLCEGSCAEARVFSGMWGLQAQLKGPWGRLVRVHGADLGGQQLEGLHYGICSPIALPECQCASKVPKPSPG